ncbi:hypothetical protein RhiirC2_867682 [Rhizophagus irregularis]|uniref:Uncharacterized protein n=1 Tax=Rhizophagus irregularis TaxID=588596 RepID=A0A2N1N158_9GLOM|nr:hypothetical protein RhiirC2_867682 [Rhizophagus irregularis]
MPVNRKSFMQRARKTVRDMVRAREHRNRINGISTVGNISNSQFVERIASNNTEFEPHIRRDSATDQSEVDASTVAAGQEIQLVFYTCRRGHDNHISLENVEREEFLYRAMMAFKCDVQEAKSHFSRELRNINNICRLKNRSADVSGLANQIMLDGCGGSYVTRLSTI